MNSYYTDDPPQRLVMLWIMALLVLYANNAEDADTNLTAMRMTAGSYILARFTTSCIFIVTSIASYQHRAQMRIMAAFMFVGLAIVSPLLSASVSLQTKAILIALNMLYQEITWTLTLSPWIKRKLRLTYSTAVDISHEVDRMAAFFIIILGEFIYSVVVGNPTGTGITRGYLKAVCTLVVAFTLNWIYASGDGGGPQSVHPIRHSVWAGFGYFLLHLPLSASFLIGGHVAAVCVDVDHLPVGQRWLLGGGLGTGMACLWVYGMLYRTSSEERRVLPKQTRISMRLIVAIALALLPLLYDPLTLDAELFLIAVTVIHAILLAWETVGGLAVDAHFFEPWDCRNAPSGPRVAVSEDDENM